MSLSETRYPWNLTQPHIDLLATSLAKLEAVLDLASPGGLAAENAAKLLTDLRVQTVAAGAEDPCPHRDLYPSFAVEGDCGRAMGRCKGEDHG